MEQFWQFLVITDLKATERPKNTGSIRTYLTSVREVKVVKGEFNMAFLPFYQLQHKYMLQFENDQM